MSILASALKEFSIRFANARNHPIGSRYRRLHDFIEARLQEDIYSETSDSVHERATEEALERIESRWGLRGKLVLDVGSGQGIALAKFAQYGAIAKGLTFGPDFTECRRKGYDVFEMDMSFLDFPDETFDLVWARHSLEHSLFPYFTLHILSSVLKRGGVLYAEVPAPDTAANHQLNRNHYSCLTRSSWQSLFERVGLSLVESFDIHVELACGPDIWYSFYLKKP